MTRPEYCTTLKPKRHNCCQSVLMTFADQIDADPKVLFALSQPMGGGTGGTMEGMCGALQAACMLAGLRYSDGAMEQTVTAPQVMRLTRELIEAFRQQAGALICKDLKGIETGQVLCACPDCIRIAATLVQEKIFPETIGDEME